MPRILTRLDFMSENIPKFEDFSYARRVLRRFLNHHEQVEFVSLFGSFSRGEHSVLSDIDIFIVYSGRTSAFTKDLRRFVQKDLSDLSIPIEMLVYKKDHLERGLHDLNGSILHEIRFSAQHATLTGKFDFSSIKVPNEPLAGFFASKHKGRFKDYPFLNRSLKNNGREVAEYLQKLSQTLIPMLEKSLYQNGLLPDKALSKKEVFDLYKSQFGDSVLNKYKGLFESLEEIQSMIKKHIAYGDTDLDLYDDMLRGFFNMTPNVLEFLEDIESESRKI